MIKHHIQTESEISRLIREDPVMMEILRAAEELDLPDWWIGAGFLRNKIWDYMEGNPSVSARDIDLVYFNPNDIDQETDWKYDEQMKQKYPYVDWEIRNQARMHHVNNFDPFTSTGDGIAHWVETATCVAVKLRHGAFQYLFCYGTDDLFHLVARPTKFFASPDKMATFNDRVQSKKWQERWPDLRLIAINS